MYLNANIGAEMSRMWHLVSFMRICSAIIGADPPK
jgi:hypothetical protein